MNKSVGWAMVVLVAGLWAGELARAASAAADFRCTVCSRVGEEGEQVLMSTDPVTQQPRTVCMNCKSLQTVCFLCGIPVADGGRDLGDGRLLCTRDGQAAVLDAAEASRSGSEARRAVERVHARFMQLPAGGVSFLLEDQKAMARALSAGPRVCAYPYLRVSRHKQEGGVKHEVGLLTGQPRSWLVLEAAHAWAHVWLLENMPAGRQVEQVTVEAFCDLVAWRSAEELGLIQERVRMEKSRLTDDQLGLFLEADRLYDFNAVKEWVLRGKGLRLLPGELDKVRILDESLAPVAPARVPVVPAVASGTPGKSEPRDRLVLNGLLGSGAKRLALVNEIALAKGEKGRVRLADGAMELECVEIRTNSVVLKVLATGQEVELHMKQKP